VALEKALSALTRGARGSSQVPQQAEFVTSRYCQTRPATWARRAYPAQYAGFTLCPDRLPQAGDLRSRSHKAVPVSLELNESLLDVDLLLLQMADLIVNLVERQLQVCGRNLATALLGDHRADLGEGEAELLPLQNHREARAVTGIINARSAISPGREKTAVLVEAQRPQRDPELAGEVADRVSLGTFGPALSKKGRLTARLFRWS
jgi:hypothetical protein